MGGCLLEEAELRVEAFVLCMDPDFAIDMEVSVNQVLTFTVEA